MRKAYVELYDESVKPHRRMGYQFEENTRINVDKMLRLYITNILGTHPEVISVGERSCFTYETDDGGNVTIYKGDLKNFQERGLSGLDRIVFSKSQIDMLKEL